MLQYSFVNYEQKDDNGSHSVNIEINSALRMATVICFYKDTIHFTAASLSLYMETNKVCLKVS